MKEVQEIIPKSFQEFLTEVENFKADTRWCFRGQASSAWKLIPKAGRPPFNKWPDDYILKVWQRRAIEFVSTKPDTVWDWLALAQHHGLPTRLMDWTRNPLVAAFFSCYEQREDDGIVYVLFHEYSARPEDSDPFKFEGDFTKFRPSANTARVVRQHSFFTVQKEPQMDLAEIVSAKRLKKIIITKELKLTFLDSLNFLGYNKYSLFPGLDGLSEYMCWHIANPDLFKDLTPDQIP